MSIFDLGFMKGYIKMADDGAKMLWHERNGGNLSYRMSEEDVSAAKAYFKSGAKKPLGISAKNLGGEYFLVTGTGKFFSNIKDAPEENLCIARLDEAGETYEIVWGNALPTSELPSHILNHSAKKEASGGAYRIIYHAHVPALIALSFVLPQNAKDMSRALWSMMPECPIVFPGGVGVVPWMMPGSREIALASSALMKDFDIILWAHHGAFASGEDFDATFGLMHTVEKAADIYIKAMAAGGIKNVVGFQNIRNISKVFGVRLRAEFLD